MFNLIKSIDTLNKAREYARQNVLMILAVVAVVALGLTFYFYSEYSALKNPDKSTQEETAKLIAQVGKLMVLPEGETPTAATVSDPEKLQSNPFFAKAKKGDRVLIYAKAKKAILYNPESNKIIEVAPIDIGDSKK